MTTRNLRLLLTVCSLTAVGAFGGGVSQAAEFELGEANLAIDTVGSVGFGVRVHDQDCTFISEPNGGCSSNGAFFAINDDDGNVNFERGDFINATAKITTDFDLRWRNYGAFVRASAFYDYIGAEKAGQNSTRFGRRPLNDSLRGSSPESRAGRDFKLLDAFVYGNFNVGNNLPLNVRVGNQVINWGESLFIQGGINSNLSFDVTALRTPGAELKEAVLPQPAFYAGLGLPANFNLAAYYVWDYKRTKIDTVGTYFSGSDGAGEEGAYIMNGVEFAESILTPFGPLTPQQADAQGFLVPRTAGTEAGDQGQWGVKLGYYAEWLNQGTDLGFYFQNFHNKLPIGTFTASQVPGSPNWGQTCLGIVGNGGAPASTCIDNEAVVGGILLNGAAFKEYRNTYIEDIEMWGASFNTSIDLLGGTALAGEIAYSSNMPFQISDVEVNANDLDRSLAGQAAAFVGATPGATINDLVTFLGTQNATPLLTQWSSLTNSGEIPGFKRANVVTGQIHTLSTLTASEPIVDFSGADLMVLLANVGFQYLPDQSDDNERFSIPRSGAGHANPLVSNFLGQGLDGHYATSTSWGYRLVGALDYNNAFGIPWTVTPSIQFAHDVSGFSAGPVGPGFVEGRKTVSLGVSASYQNSWRAEIRYTNSFGNKFNNYSYDKDFATFNVSYAF